MNQQKRATFEDVCNAQDKLDYLILTFIQKNEPLTMKQQKEFKKYFRLATMGLAGEFKFYIHGKYANHDLFTAGKAARWLSKRGKNPVHFLNPEECIEIKECWKQLWDVLDKIYDPALELSIKISQEQTHHGSSEPAMV